MIMNETKALSVKQLLLASLYLIFIADHYLNHWWLTTYTLNLFKLQVRYYIIYLFGCHYIFLMYGIRFVVSYLLKDP